MTRKKNIPGSRPDVEHTLPHGHNPKQKPAAQSTQYDAERTVLHAHETVRVTFNIPLVDFTWHSGATEVLPGSHHLPRDFAGVVGVPNLYPYVLRMNVGDAVFRDGNILHRGTPNFGDEVRPMLDQTYKKVLDTGGGRS